MTMRITIFNEQAIREALHETVDERTQIAHEIVAEGRAVAKVRTGEYRGGMAVETAGDQVSVVDNDPEAFWKEYGTSDTPAHAALTNAARKHGRYTGYQPKGP
jgi:hypothetical protein